MRRSMYCSVRILIPRVFWWKAAVSTCSTTARKQSFWRKPCPQSTSISAFSLTPSPPPFASPTAPTPRRWPFHRTVTTW